MPAALRMIESSSVETWTQRPASPAGGLVAAVVHIDMLPLGALGKRMTPEERAAYAEQIQEAQDRLIPEIEALGGEIRGRFLYASAGLAVDVPVERAEDLRTLGGVTAVHGVANYALDLRETVPWIGAAAVHERLGFTGRGVNVAVIDTGIDYTHAKLGGPGTREAYNTAYCGDPAVDPFDPTTGVCAPAHDAAALVAFPNEKVRGGYDWVGEVWPNPDPRCGRDSQGNPRVCLAPDPNPIDIQGHGTHVADIIAGLDASAEGEPSNSGVAPGANIWAYKACSATSTACSGLALLLAIDDAMDLDNDTATYDPADIINLSLGAIYGQPEDDLTLFVNIAGYYGSLVVASAGNSGDKPYIVSSPSTASAAISVAESTAPSVRLFQITAGAVQAGGALQPWSAALTAPLSGPLQYGDGAGGNLNGCSPYAAPQTGRVLLVDRGVCPVSIKAANATAAGAALVLIANNQFSNTPPSFSYGGGEVGIPALTITMDDGLALKEALAATPGLIATVDPEAFIRLQDDIVASSSRGPRIADGAIKPDIAAPGAHISAVAGSGNGTSAFSGTSGAAPMVAGSAALVVEALVEREVIPGPGLGLVEEMISLGPLVKALLMNTANPDTYIGGSAANGGRGFLAPITLQGAGRVDVLAALQTRTMAWDVTALYQYVRDWQAGLPVDSPCAVRPVLDVLFYYFMGVLPPCAADSDFGNDFFAAWTAQTGSVSFGYDGVSGFAAKRRQILVVNLNSRSQTYQISSDFRYDDDRDKGATMRVSDTLTIRPTAPVALINVVLELRARDMRDWSLDAGQYGASGTNIYCNDPTYNILPIVGEPGGAGCPTLQMFEIDGMLTIDGGPYNRVRLPWQVLPERSANTYMSSVWPEESLIRFRNPSRFKAGDVDIFALVDISPNKCDVVDRNGNCLIRDYVPGIVPGLNASPVDLHEVGVRSYVVPGLNERLGLPPAPIGAVPDEVIEFALSVHDAPYRASHNFPVMFQILVDANLDGTVDYIVFNSDLARTGTDGRNAVFVCTSRATGDPAVCDATDPVRPYFFSLTDFNSQNWVLSAPAMALGLNSNQQFRFAVRASDVYFSGLTTDCSPENCAGFHTFRTGMVKYWTPMMAFQVDPRGSYDVPYTLREEGIVASPSQIGLLFFHRDSEIGRESSRVRLDP